MASSHDGQQPVGYDSDSGFESLDAIHEDRESVDDDEVLLNVSPNKYEKPKDQLYMDFFVKYTKLFVDENRPSPQNTKLAIASGDSLGSARGQKREDQSTS